MRGNGRTKFGASHPAQGTALVATGMFTQLSNKTAKIAGAMVTVQCMHCDEPFTRYACHVYRRNRYFCGRGCTNEARLVRIATECRVCQKPMEQTPSDAVRVVTCSRECLSVHRSVEHPKNPYHERQYRAAMMKAREASTCIGCGRTHGPWIVRNALTDPRLLCRNCYASENTTAIWAARKTAQIPTVGISTGKSTVEKHKGSAP